MTSNFVLKRIDDQLSRVMIRRFAEDSDMEDSQSARRAFDLAVHGIFAAMSAYAGKEAKNAKAMAVVLDKVRREELNLAKASELEEIIPGNYRELLVRGLCDNEVVQNAEVADQLIGATLPPVLRALAEVDNEDLATLLNMLAEETGSGNRGAGAFKDLLKQD